MGRVPRGVHVSAEKKAVRDAFRSAVFERDGFRCRLCGLQVTEGTARILLDAHHITPRDDMPNGGYVVENGITLCKERCHPAAENGAVTRGRLYKRIRSTHDRAYAASLLLCG